MADRVTGHVNLKQRQRGPVWYLKYRLADGRQVQRMLGPAWTHRSWPPVGYFTRRTAEEALHALLADARRGTLTDSGIRSGRTFGDACSEWLRYVEHDRQRRPSTIRDYSNTVNGSLIPEFGKDTPLEQITTERIDQYRERLLDEGELSRRSVQKVLVILYGILKRAKRKKWITTSNPAEDVERVTVKRSGDFNVLSPVEVEAVARAAKNEQDAAIFTVAAFTGLRLGELRALRWRDVDFGKQTVLVRGSFTHGAAGPPKSGKVRSVPLIDQAARALDGLSRREHFTAPDDLVFCTPVGEYLNDDGLRDRFYVALDVAGLGDKRRGANPMVFHDLRHTFGTLAVEAWPLHDVQAYMGHADIQTTMIYVHHQPKAAAADRLSELVAQATGAGVSPTVSRNAEIGAQLSATGSVESPGNTGLAPV
jgi:integrase